MSKGQTALVVVDVQESFRHRAYWDDRDVPAFVQRLQALIDGAKAQGVPVVQVLHVEGTGVFSVASGHVRTLEGVEIEPEVRFEKRSHSALVGSGLDVWLVQQGIGRLIVCGIRTEQCCETTTRHASDLGYEVDFVTEATMTWAMTDRQGREWSPEEIRARTELVLDGRFATVVRVDEALERALEAVEQEVAA
ncbi:isochorismatase family protein [Edaphobacter aggregans]|uniref:isochorismatase family protein n=1 Tax=Edaphobacter aggregans TaxID=570835 RepID=UPI000553FD86|nr:isochorismatase family protein [Edaphobacter aggregans]